MPSLPVPSKTWQFSHVTVPPLGSGTTDIQRGLRTGIVNAFLGFALGAATVAGSSNSLAAGMDGVNRWLADANLVWAASGVAHSWIVLNFGSKFFLLLDLNSATPLQMSAYLSFAGFTGGTTTARPTATDEAQVCGTGSNPAAWLNVATDVQRVWHVMMPTDSSNFRVIAFETNLQQTFWQGGVATNTVAGWTHPIFGKITFSSDFPGHGVYGNLAGFGGMGIIGVMGATPMNFGYTTEGVNQALGQVETVPNDIDGGYPITSIGLYSNTVGKSGRMGQAVDIWWGSTTPTTGDSYPSDGSAQFMQIGNMVYVWDGTALTTA